MRRKILQVILGLITKRIVKRYNPIIIAVTGSAGKTSTKDALAIFLERYFSVRKSPGNLNTEFGLPLVFIGAEKSGGKCILSWLKIIFSGIKKIVKEEKSYPKMIIVEMGADRPGDISYLTGLVKPQVSVLTLISDSPVHLGNYQNLDQLIQEKSEIIRPLNSDDYAVLNFDDPRVRALRKETKAKVIYYGFDEGADVRISNFSYRQEQGYLKGIVFAISYKEEKKVIYLPNCLGKPFAYAVAAALSCGIVFNLGLNRAADIFRDFEPEKGRLNLIDGRSGSLILDDTYNASPASVKSALETLSQLPAERRIAVLGDMKELGGNSQKAHREIGSLAAGIVDILIAVGQEAKEIRDEAVEMGLGVKNSYHFEDLETASETVKEIASAGDLILVKGSQSMRMEKIIEKAMKNPGRAGELLVRQETSWKKR